ncbi:MAG: response regulator transcription factor [bacterium]|nr:response regulator transcription factor [bacterium]
MTTEVLIVDDQELIRDGLMTLLERQEGITVVGTASNGVEAVKKVDEFRPDVVLMDVRMPIMDGIQAARAIREQFPSVCVLMLTTFDDEEFVLEALKAGAIGYILKNIPAVVLGEAVRLAKRGVMQIDPGVTERLVSALTAVSALPPPITPLISETQLTEREREVVQLVAEGANNREIAQRLFISEGTVKTHISNILSQLGLRDRTQLAVYVHQHGRDAKS